MDLSAFNNAKFDRGASKTKELAWLLLRGFFFDRSNLPWYRTRRALLRAFGATLGSNPIIKPRVRITFPWRITLGDHVWLGDHVQILNLADITIGDNCCVSQNAFLCTGSHDWSRHDFRLITAPIVLEAEVWICANVFIGPGVTIGKGSVVTAGSVVTRNLPPGMICSGNPCVPVKPRTEH